MKDLVKDLAEKRCIEALYTGGSITWSPNGKSLFSSCTHIIKAIDLEKNLSTYTIGDADDETLRITCLAVDKNRNRLLVAYNNQVIREYEIPLTIDDKPTLARSWKTMHTAPILIMKFDDEGVRLATGSADNSVKVWNLTEQQCTHTLKGPSVVSAIEFAQNDRLVIGYIEGQLHLFDLMRGVSKKFLHEWKNHNSQITGIVKVPNTRKVVAVSRDQTISIHETETRETLKVLPLFESIESAVIGHNGNLFTVGEEGTIKEWIIDTAKLVRKQNITKSLLDHISYEPITNRFLATSAEENIFVIGFDFNVQRQIVGFHDEIYSCCQLGTDGKYIAVASNTSEIRLYDSETLDCQLVRGHSESVLTVTTAEWDPSILASCSKDNSIILWRLNEEKGELLPLIAATGHANSVTAVAFSNTSRSPYIASVSVDSTLKLWSISNLPKVPTTNEDVGEGLVDKLPKLACSSTIVAHAKDANCIDVSETDGVIATGGMDKLVKLWQVDTGKMQLGIGGTLTGHRRGVGDVKFSKNSHKLASSSGDLTIKVWNVQDKTCLQTLTGHSCAVFRVLWLNSGQQLISADSAGIVKIWTLKNSECEASIEAHTDKIWSLSASKDESEFISTGSDGRIVFWKDVTEEKQKAEDEKRKEKMVQEQTLTNLLSEKMYQEALDYALGLVRPHCALKVINELIDVDQLQDALRKLDDRKTQVLLDFATQWNTNSRTSQAAQTVLNSLLLIHPPEEFLALPNARGIVESFLPYTKRHMERLNRARQDAALLEFVWKQMRIA